MTRERRPLLGHISHSPGGSEPRFLTAMNDQTTAPASPPRRFSPSRLYRHRPPHLYSDSQKTNEIALTREVLSHQLDTLTAQKQELVFEGFAVRLIEKFIAPNLRPQTGPIGGGDGKTDSET